VGGAIVLAGDVVGPASPNNKVVAWDHVPLLIGPGVGTFDSPGIVDAAFPIYNIGLNLWRALPMSGDATMTDGGVVTVTGGTFTLAGNVNGPSNANRFTTLNLQGNDANVTIPENDGWWAVRMRGLTADRTVTLPVAPDDGEVVVVKDGDGSLGVPHNIIIDPGPFPIDEEPGVYTMTAVQNGIKGSVSLYFDAAAPAGWYLF